MCGQTEIPPQVVAEATHTSFPIWRVKRPYDGVSVLNSTLFTMPIVLLVGLGYFLFNFYNF